ncbi:hypothetical protein [Amaricoccus sp.]|jgi:hypothetical protein|uniref:hypothetical protein n=1 Tax=Amaricoccus sp. TaxID=1872485 RepID=UPI001B4F7D89|nr:hypothetical protein [Amaricoccus sp.]MBP7243631.1 hypothetical protein [Amaricoccus sp.]
MTKLHARPTKQGNDSTSGRNAEASEPGQHPNRVDGSENPESGDALLANHESGVWNQEREAEEGAVNGLDDREEKVRSGAGVSQKAEESGRSSDGDGMDVDGGRSTRNAKK